MTKLDAISDPLRLRMVRHLERKPQSTLHELADAAGVHANTARPHVSALLERGVLVRESAAPSGRGRPAVRYRLAPGWSLPTSDFRGLAEVLAAALVRSGAGPKEIRSVGLEWGRFLLGRPGEHDLERELPQALERLGFAACVDDDTLELSACPCAQVLPDRPELICELATAVADGVLTGAGSELRVSERVHDPAARACSARLATGVATDGGRKRIKGLHRLRRRSGDDDK